MSSHKIMRWIRLTDDRMTGWELKAEIIKLPKSTCLWLQAVGSLLLLFDAVSSGRPAVDAEQHDESYADVRNFKKPKLFFFLVVQLSGSNRKLNNVVSICT